jgi:8-oxo-dGTP pyrophosphatase MutT (NUDIX family)
MKESVGILIIARDTNNFLLLHRAERPIVWSILTGTMDVEGETPLECIKREIREEININPNRVKDIQELGVVDNDRGIFHVFIGYTDTELDLNLKMDENDDYMWTGNNNLPRPIHKGWGKTFQLVEPILNLNESIKKNLKKFLYEQRRVGSRARKEKNITGRFNY